MLSSFTYITIINDAFHFILTNKILLDIGSKTMKAMGKYLAYDDIWCVIHNIRCNISEGIIC